MTEPQVTYWPARPIASVKMKRQHKAKVSSHNKTYTGVCHLPETAVKVSEINKRIENRGLTIIFLVLSASKAFPI